MENRGDRGLRQRGDGERPRGVQRADQGMRRERAQRQGAGALARVRCRPWSARRRSDKRGVGDVPLAGPHHGHEAELMSRRRRHRKRDRAARIHPARHLDHHVRRERRDRAAVAHVEDQPGGRPAAERGRQGDRHRLVPARRHVGLVPLARVPAGPQLGEVAAVALVVRRLPQPRRGGRPPPRTEPPRPRRRTPAAAPGRARRGSGRPPAHPAAPRSWRSTSTGTRSGSRRATAARPGRTAAPPRSAAAVPGRAAGRAAGRRRRPAAPAASPGG